jgi:hypothetical protein
MCWILGYVYDINFKKINKYICKILELNNKKKNYFASITFHSISEDNGVIKYGLNVFFNSTLKIIK